MMRLRPGAVPRRSSGIGAGGVVAAAVFTAEVRRRIAEDRLSIARDLHDSVAHAIAVINVQAGAAAHVGQERPQAAADALVNIRRASGEALDELTAMLSILRESDAAPVRAPAPGLAQIFELVQDVRHDGLGVSMAAEGPLDRVAPSVGTAAFRIVQESVANILRHAHAASAQISVIAGAGGELSLTVVDDGGGTSPPAGAVAEEVPGRGVGPRGMRERAESSGGRLTAAPMREGGFCVQATWGPTS